MAGTKEIKRRIKSVKNTKKITKAMELVAASKMRRAVAQALASRLYADYSWELLTSISSRIDDVTHPFFFEKKEGKTLLILITSNGTLCGGYNSQAIKKALEVIKTAKAGTLDMITIGKQGDSAMRRIGQNIVASFTDLPAILGISDIALLSTLITKEYKNNIYRDVHVVFTDFISALSQKPNLRNLLPISKKDLKELIEEVSHIVPSAEKIVIPPTEAPYLVEGNIDMLIEVLVEKLVQMQLYQMLLESGASEQAARMVAMKNANEAAGEMIDDLTLAFNKARQASITQEISEISAGMASIS